MSRAPERVAQRVWPFKFFSGSNRRKCAPMAVAHSLIKLNRNRTCGTLVMLKMFSADTSSLAFKFFPFVNQQCVPITKHYVFIPMK